MADAIEAVFEQPSAHRGVAAARNRAIATSGFQGLSEAEGQRPGSPLFSKLSARDVAAW
jgi:hypothetical protein